MEESRFDRSLRMLANSAGRRDAVQSLAAMGAAFLAAIGVSGVAEAKKQGGQRTKKSRDKDKDRAKNGGVQSEKKKKPKPKPGPAGPTGPTGPAGGPAGPTGPTGPTGQTGPQFTIVRVDGDLSPELGATANSQVQSTAQCTEAGQLLSCTWIYDGNGDQYENTISQAAPNETSDLRTCVAFLTRTADVANAGGNIIAVAVCKQ